jgi:hypothetical protein
VPAEWVARSTESLASGWGGWGYGRQWWVHPTVRIYEARGYQGQYIIVVPDYDLVVVFTASILQGPDPEDLLYDFILPAVTDPDHDVSVIDVAPSKTVVGSGHSLSVGVVVRNGGSFTETNVIVEAFANSLFFSATYITLAEANWTSLVFAWDTSGFAKGDYIISAFVWPVYREINVVNNNYIGVTVHVGVPGDVNADGSVGIDDILAVAAHFGHESTHSGWNGKYDILDDGYVGVDDIFIAACHFGEHE